MNKINILGVNLSKIQEPDLLNKIAERLSANIKTLITTPNPEIILSVRDDEELFYILNHSDFAIPDGIGLKFAAWITGNNLTRITGSDLTLKILELVSIHNYKILITIRQDSLSTENLISQNLSDKYKGKLNFTIKVVNRHNFILNQDYLNENSIDILISTLGSPYQEKQAFHALQDPANLKLALGVGGSFDFLTGKIKRAPKFFRVLGFEWLWRFLLEPKYRAKRIFKALIIFPLKFLSWRFLTPLIYRKNVACLLYKRNGENIQVLIVKRSDEPEHWQLPQGGTDGQSIKEAGVRELKEEVNAKEIEIKGVYKNIYKYKFNNKNLIKQGKSLPQRAMGHKGQKQSLLIAEFKGHDKDLKINFWDHSAWEWVNSDKLFERVHPDRKNSTKIYLEKFHNLINKKYDIKN